MYSRPNSEPIKAASKSQGPKRCSREEQRGLARDGSAFCCSDNVPVTAFSIKAEDVAMLEANADVRELLAEEGPEAAEVDLLRDMI